VYPVLIAGEPHKRACFVSFTYNSHFDRVVLNDHMECMTLTFILGGARSGKSSRAQKLAEAASPERIYIATAQALDAEMDARIARHKSDRGAGWETIEAPLDIASSISQIERKDKVVLVDCLTLWLNNLMHHVHDIEAETDTLITALKTSVCPVIIVSNEVGLGLVPSTPLGREFRDAQGQLNQKVAAACDRVEFIAAGLPLTLKG